MMPHQDTIDELRGRLPDLFSAQLLDGAVNTLEQTQNPLRAHQFAHLIRELLTHVLHTVGPSADVMRCGWYKQERDVDGPVRRQRALYSCRGGLSDEFLKKTLNIDPKSLHSELSSAFQELHKRTHVKPDTLMTDPLEIEAYAEDAIAALNDIFDTIDDIKGRIVDAVAQELQREAASVFINETIGELDEISSHYETGIVWVEEAEVISLDADTIRYRMKGSVDVTLQYGSSSDRAGDTGAEIAESFPYECVASAPVGDPTKLDSASTEMKVDTKEWFGEDAH